MRSQFFGALIASMLLGLAASTFAAGPGGGGGGGAGMGGMGGMGGPGSGSAGSAGSMSGPSQGMPQGQTNWERQQKMMRDQAQNQEQMRIKDRERIRANPDVYGAQLMNDREIARYREQLKRMNTEQQRAAFMQKHQANMNARASRMGVKIETAADLDRDRIRDQDRLQTPDQDRDQLRDRDRLDTPDQDRDQLRDRDRLDTPDQDRDQTRDRDRIDQDS